MGAPIDVVGKLAESLVISMSSVIYKNAPGFNDARFAPVIVSIVTVDLEALMIDPDLKVAFTGAGSVTAS